jgi:hypothetical protein
MIFTALHETCVCGSCLQDVGSTMMSLLPVPLVVAIMSMRSGDRVPWASQLRRIHAGMPPKTEWMAPARVVNQVRGHYQQALDWQHDSALKPFALQWREASDYLSGMYLRRYRAVLHHQRQTVKLLSMGVLRADHRIEVRRFSEYGDSCLIIDYQTQRRMATYDYETRTRLHTQDMGDCTIVCQMIYDRDSEHWKIDRYIQQLPSGWGNPQVDHLQGLGDFPMASGRDH